MNEKDIFETLFKISDLLKSMKIPYVLVGAFAFGSLGGARGTMDVDVMILADSRTFDFVKESAIKAGFEYDRLWAKVNPLLKGLQIRLSYRGMPVDVLLPRDDQDRKAIERRKRKKIEGKFLWIPTPEDFVLQKIKVGRPRDFEDALIILQYHLKKIDRNYLNQWASLLGIEDEMSYLFSSLASKNVNFIAVP